MALSKTLWHVINIKARTDQTTAHYYNAIQKLREQDPLVYLSEDKVISLMGVEETGPVVNRSTELPEWVVLKLMSYVIVDPDGFYDRRRRQDVTIEWNDDWVSNKKEAEVFFCFSNHTLAVRKHSKIALNYIRDYFGKALAEIEPETFDVDIITDHGIIEAIKNAHEIISIEASISFGNPGHASGFARMFDQKINDANPEELEIKLRGSTSHPLANPEDGLVNAVVNAAERDGELTATIRQGEGSRLEKIETRRHPRIVEVTGDRNSFWQNVWVNIRGLFQ